MSASYIDEGFRQELLRCGFALILDERGSSGEVASLYQLALPATSPDNFQSVVLTPRVDGFVAMTPVASVDLVSREVVESVRDPKDRYSLTVFPPPIEGDAGSWSLGVGLGEYLWGSNFPGWPSVVENPETRAHYVNFLVEQCQKLREYAWKISWKISESVRGDDLKLAPEVADVPPASLEPVAPFTSLEPSETVPETRLILTPAVGAEPPLQLSRDKALSLEPELILPELVLEPVTPEPVTPLPASEPAVTLVVVDQQESAFARPTQDSVNLYEEFGLDRADPTDAIRTALRQELAPNWRVRAEKAGKAGEKARQMMAYLALADEVFASEEAREAYDHSLRGRPAATESTSIDWQSRAWNYYYMQDIGAASVAARKAREQAPEDPIPFVITAWVELAEEEVRRAKQAADEGFVLDELGEDTADVHHVRGAVFLMMGQYRRAVESLDRALAKATVGETPPILYRKALAQEGLKEVPGMIASCVRALSTDVELTSRLRQWLEQTTCRAFHLKCHQESDAAASGLLYVETHQGVGSSNIIEPSKGRVLDYLKMEIRAAALAEEGRPKGDLPGLPLKSAAVAVIALVFISAHPAFVAIMLGAAGFAAYTMYLRSQWNGQFASHQSAQAELNTLNQQVDARRGHPIVPIDRG